MAPRMYPIVAALAFFAALLALPPLALALDTEVRRVDGSAPPEGKVRQTFQEIEVAIHDQVAATRTLYQFENADDGNVEVTVNLALRHGEVVEGFSYWNGEEHIVGEVLEKQAAAEVYQQLTGVNHDPGILEQADDVFRLRVFPVAPAEKKPIEVRTLATLEVAAGVVEYVVPRADLPGDGVPFSLRVEVSDDLPIAGVETIGLAGTVTRQGPGRVRVDFDTAGTAFADDVRIRYRLASKDHALRFVAHRDGDADGSFMLLVSPKDTVDAAEVLGRDVVFVVDISGSMTGEPLARVKSALASILGRLGPTDRFDVLPFESDCRPVFGALRDADPATRDGAVAAVRALQTRGGTNLDGALSRALDELGAPAPGRPHAIVFLTDGQGDAPAESTLAMVARRHADARIFPVGIGNGVNRRFLERLGRDNRGTATFIESPDGIEARMAALYGRMAMPLLTDLALRFEGVEVYSVYPQRLPDLYRDGQVVVFGRFRDAGRGLVRLSGRDRGGAREVVLPIELPAAEPRFAHVEKLWAARRIDQLLETIESRRAEPGADGELVQEVTRLGIVYNLVTPYTTFLAVPESLQTGHVKELIRQGRMGYGKRLVDGMKNVRLSQADIPPGDPVLTVDAPADALKVVAYFPFGLTKRLDRDDVRGRWSVRFLVPRDVPDGLYTIRVAIHHADGHVEWRHVEYRIDATEPEFEAFVPDEAAEGEDLRLDVDPFEPVDQVQAYVVGVEGLRVDLKLDPETGHYVGILPLSYGLPESITVRILVRDKARNRFERDFPVVIDGGSEFDC